MSKCQKTDQEEGTHMQCIQRRSDYFVMCSFSLNKKGHQNLWHAALSSIIEMFLIYSYELEANLRQFHITHLEYVWWNIMK